MDLQSREIEFVQEFLKIQSEEVLAKLEKILFKEITTPLELEAMSLEELNQRIDKSETDFNQGKFKTTEQLLDKYK